jgi:hypothetical protein
LPAHHAQLALFFKYVSLRSLCFSSGTDASAVQPNRKNGLQLALSRIATDNESQQQENVTVSG